MNKFLQWTLSRNSRKKKSILTHLFIKIINLIKNEDQRIMYNVLFNQINTNYKYTENKNGKYIIFGKDGVFQGSYM